MQFVPRILGCKAPLDLGARGVALVFQLLDLSPERLLVADPPVEALAAEDAQLDLGDVEPTAMLRRVMELQLPQYAPRLRGRERLIQRGRAVRVQIIEHDADNLRPRVGFVRQPLHLTGEVLHRPLLRHLDMPVAALRLTEEEEVTHPLTAVLVVVTLRLTRRGRQWRARLGDQLLACLVKADDGALLIVGFFIQVQHVFHAGDELGVDLADTPLLFQPRLEFVFLSTWRTVSRAMVEAKPNSTTLSDNSRSVQRARPAGGVLQATATKWASCFPVSLRACPRRGRSFKHSRPSSTKRRRVRSTVLMPQESAATICSSVPPSAARSRIRARVTLRAEGLPRRTSWRNCSRSSAERSTRYFFLGMADQAPLRGSDRTIPAQRANHQNQMD